ncbi:hypothetical protein PUNSTDRAFT_65201 [Punctularia strigosozonata HHB-11173 SS5]|uniref:uncharacterized protein n=1 Tax=Punctularia strigosozonata (strain HHB-11173) TaxID=741275 RepID=UPI000441681A|nr:uncharacterized protein PUNSTDRAFT_65201 [Punctularia strigosozonata HHB-11173 SS5]EIN10410.1 hypothetical protein PUNSTDRAFT_65201 [Punctularia strigosozonata HHB-11173 SS5]
MLKRQTFICVLCNALFSFGAPQHRIEEQLMAAARILNVRMGVIQLPAIAWIAFPRQGGLDKSLHIIRCQEGLALGKLHQVHQISRRVMHDEIYASEGRRQIDVLLNSGPEYGLALGIFLQFWISAIICGLAFGGSFLDMWVGGFAGASMRFMQSRVQDKTKYYLADLCLATLISFAARGLSSITVPDQLFCYTAITYSGIVGILPGFLVLTAALEIASRNMMTGGIKVVRALALTLFIGFALQLGDQLWRIKDIHAGCYRPDTFPWYLRSWPWWTQIFAVPIFSALASLGNQQPWRSWDFPVMVVISCAAYAANWAANHFIHSRLEFVAFIGAFVVGLIGSVYSRVAKRTAFTVMVTGVCFLVPSGLAETGGISAQDNAIPIEYAMIRTGLGIAVGLLFSAILTYSIGGTKHSGTMTF